MSYRSCRVRALGTVFQPAFVVHRDALRLGWGILLAGQCFVWPRHLP
jgi:hypothetical protein